MGLLGQVLCHAANKELMFLAPCSSQPNAILLALGPTYDNTNRRDSGQQQTGKWHYITFRIPNSDLSHSSSGFPSHTLPLLFGQE